MRIKNTRPTSIYWLYDTRTGFPCYCGKTVSKPKYRLGSHFAEAARVSDRPVLRWLVEAGRENVRIEVVEVVPSEVSWAEREKYWVAKLREVNPACLNVSEGGAGTPGLIHTPDVISRRAAAIRGRKMSDSFCANISNVMRDRLKDPVEKQKLTGHLKGRVYSAETLAKMSVAQKARFAKTPRIFTPELRAKMSASAKRRCALAKSGVLA